MRYQFYREHKFVSSALNEVERLIAKTDFQSIAETEKARLAFKELSEMLESHAQYENEKIHSLLSIKVSTVHLHAQDDHDKQDRDIAHIDSLFIDILKNPSNRVELGYKLYLTYRKFVSDNLAHLHEEETLILPELQRLYTDDELRQVEAETYQAMTVEQMKEMLDVLFPHMNSSDKAHFLKDIELLQPEKHAALIKMLGWL